MSSGPFTLREFQRKLEARYPSMKDRSLLLLIDMDKDHLIEVVDPEGYAAPAPVRRASGYIDREVMVNASEEEMDAYIAAYMLTKRLMYWVAE